VITQPTFDFTAPEAPAAVSVAVLAQGTGTCVQDPHQVAPRVVWDASQGCWMPHKDAGWHKLMLSDAGCHAGMLDGTN